MYAGMLTHRMVKLEKREVHRPSQYLMIDERWNNERERERKEEGEDQEQRIRKAGSRPSADQHMAAGGKWTEFIRPVMDCWIWKGCTIGSFLGQPRMAPACVSFLESSS